MQIHYAKRNFIKKHKASSAIKIQVLFGETEFSVNEFAYNLYY